MDSSVHPEGLELQDATEGATVALLNGSGDVVVNISSDISKPTNEIEANCLEEIDQIPKLKLILADWENKYKESRQRIDRKESFILGVKNEIYNLIGFFSVFQGVVLTTVSQASALTCYNWWGPFSLSLVCSIATLFALFNKFYNFFEWKTSLADEVENSKVLRQQIHSLKKFGRNFDFSRDAPDQDNQKKEERKKENNSWRHLILNRYIILAFLVLLSMLGFSAIILISCYRILCDPGAPAPTPSQ